MFGENLKRARELRDLSQAKLARLISVSQQTVGSWEVNRTSPPPETIARISVVLNVTTDYLLGISDELTPSKSADLPRKEKISEDFLSLDGINDVDFINQMKKIIELKRMAEHNKNLDNELANEFMTED